MVGPSELAWILVKYYNIIANMQIFRALTGLPWHVYGHLPIMPKSLSPI